jgi:hypothetical protein
LRLLAGVDEQALAQVPGERARYTALGGVLLGTAVIAAFSMWMAFGQTLGRGSWIAVVPALAWGVFILNLDRWLVSSATGTSMRSRFSTLLPRLVLAVFFGIVIAEPLVLKVFETAVVQRVNEQRGHQIDAYESLLKRCNPTTGAVVPSDACADATLTVSEPTAASVEAELARVEAQAASLQRIVDRDAVKYAALNDLARRECNGDRGPGLTNVFGEGPNCGRLRAEADQYARTHQIEHNVAVLAGLRTTIGRLQTQAANAAQRYERAVTSAIRAAVSEHRSNFKEIGLLERFEALHQISSRSLFLRLAVLFITLLFVAIDCLPVLVKMFSGTTHYDRIVGATADGGERAAVAAVDARTRAELAEHEVELFRIDLEVQVRKDEIASQIKSRAARASIELSDAADEYEQWARSRFGRRQDGLVSVDVPPAPRVAPDLDLVTPPPKLNGVHASK